MAHQNRTSQFLSIRLKPHLGDLYVACMVKETFIPQGFVTTSKQVMNFEFFTRVATSTSASSQPF